MRNDVIKCIVIAALLYFLYPVLLGYCSVWASGKLFPGVLAALLVTPLAGVYGYWLGKGAYRTVLILLPTLPLLYLLTSVVDEPKLLSKSIFDIVAAVVAFVLAAIIGGGWRPSSSRTT